jgi:hypothetical protein
MCDGMKLQKNCRASRGRHFSPKTVQTCTVRIYIYGPGSSVCIATDYGLDDPGIEFWWRRDFPRLFRPAPGPTQPPVQWVPGLSRE